MNKKIVYALIFYFSIFVLNACSVIENVSIQNKTSSLNSQFKESKFGEIYEESSNSLKLKMTKEQFISRIESLVEKMKTVDENLAFKKSEFNEILSPVLNSENSIISFEKLENNNTRVELLFFLAKENYTFKLMSISLVQKTDDGKFNINYLEKISEISQ